MKFLVLWSGLGCCTVKCSEILAHRATKKSEGKQSIHNHIHSVELVFELVTILWIKCIYNHKTHKSYSSPFCDCIYQYFEYGNNIHLMYGLEGNS